MELFLIKHTYHRVVVPFNENFKGQKVKTCFSLKIAMLHIKLERMKPRTPYKQIFCPYTSPLHLKCGSKGQSIFSESGHGAYHNEGKEA